MALAGSPLLPVTRGQRLHRLLAAALGPPVPAAQQGLVPAAAVRPYGTAAAARPGDPCAGALQASPSHPLCCCPLAPLPAVIGQFNSGRDTTFCTGHSGKHTNKLTRDCLKPQSKGAWALETSLTRPTLFLYFQRFRI